MVDVDEVALRRLHAVALHAIGEQDGHVADQLHAAMSEGLTSFRVDQRDDALFVVVVVDGYDVCAVDARTLADP